MDSEFPVFDGFEILELISDSGGQADVYRARQTSVDDRLVAIKFYREPLRDDRDQRRFLREVRAMVELGGHGNVVRLERADLAHGKPYLVMELCERSLGDQLKAEGPLPPAQVADVAVRACNALSAAHAKKILHRDLKPTNLLWTKFGELVVADFGIATLGSTGSDMTATMLRGTPGYLAPELLNGSLPSIQSDIFALGVTMYMLLYGRVPTAGERINDAAVPAGLANAVSAALSARPEDRPRTANEFASMVTDSAPQPAPPRPPHHTPHQASRQARPNPPTLIDSNASDQPWLDRVDLTREPVLSPETVIEAPSKRLQSVGRVGLVVLGACTFLLGVVYWPAILWLVMAGIAIVTAGYPLLNSEDDRAVRAGQIAVGLGGVFLTGSLIYFVFGPGGFTGALLSVVAWGAGVVAFGAKWWWLRQIQMERRARRELAEHRQVVHEAELAFERSGHAPLWLRELLGMPAVRLYRLKAGSFEYAAASGNRVGIFRTVDWPNGRYRAVPDRPFVIRDDRPYRPGAPDIAPAINDLDAMRRYLPGVSVKAFVVVTRGGFTSNGVSTAGEELADLVLVTADTATDVAGRYLAGDAYRIDVGITSRLLTLTTQTTAIGMASAQPNR